MSGRLLIIEDEPGLVRSLTDRFESLGFLVASESDGQLGLETARAGTWDVILLDIMLPGLEGHEVCRRLRETGDSTPVIMLTARSSTSDKVSGLMLGADDYVAKPFEMAELAARVQALIRRSRSAPAAGPPVLRAGGILLDTRRRKVTVDGRNVTLSAREFDLLAYMLGHAGEVIGRDRLLRDVWGYRDAPVTRTVDVHVAQLRMKIETDSARPRYLRTVHGVGYRLDV